VVSVGDGIARVYGLNEILGIIILVLGSLILVFVLGILVCALWHFHYQKNPIPQRIVHGTTIEILWTIFPSIILKIIFYQSLYRMSRSS
jgi:heme/copper-type cytochrome/quinol oxidase subunit 2